jgi:hypothetical protein
MFAATQCGSRSLPIIARTALLAGAGLLTACSGSGLSDIKAPNFLSFSSNDDSNIPSIDKSSTIPIILTSNKQKTQFTINGKPLEMTKSLEIKVPDTQLKITAAVPSCYRQLEQNASAGGFGPMSQFEFTFANWDKLPEWNTRTCE